MFQTVFISHGLTGFKTLVVASLSTFTGWAAGETVLAMQTSAAANPAWYENPAVIAATVTATFLLLGKVFDHYAEKNKSNSSNQINWSTKAAELSFEERKGLLGGLNHLHHKEIQFYQEQLIQKEVSEFEARERAHRLGNELNRYVAHILKLHSTMSHANLDIPEFQIKSNDEITFGLMEEVTKFRESLRKRNKLGG